MAKDIKLSANISKQVEDQLTKEVDSGVKSAEKNVKNMTLEVDPKVEAKGLGKVQELIEKAIDKKMNIAEETDATIRKLDKDLDTLQKKLDKAGALATQLKKEAKEVDKTDTLVKSNTGYKSKDKVVKTNREGKPITQEDIWKQDEERIEKSRKLTNEQKEDLKDLSKRQKQLNTLKENTLNIIDEINNKEEKTEEDIIKQYKAAVNLKKVLEEMEQTKLDISKIIGKDKYDETSKITVPKSIIPNKDKNIGAKDAVEKYIEDYKLESKLKQVYNRDLKQKETEKAKHLDDKKFENSQNLNTKDLEEAKKQVLEKQEAIAKAEQSIDNQLNILKQETLNSVEDYLKVADKDTQNTSKKLEAALKKIGTYIGSGGDLDIINNGIDEIIKNNQNLGGKTDKEKELFSWNLEDLKLMLESVEDFKETTNEYFEDGLIKNQIDIQLDDDISKLEEIKKKLQEQKENREKYIKSAQEIGQLASDTIQSGNSQLIEQTGQNAEKNINNNTTFDGTQDDIPISVVPEVKPEEFVSKITEQLKGHSVKVDVELNSENITEEVKKITEMIPDKKEIEISIGQDETKREVNRNTGVNDTSGINNQENIKEEIANYKELLELINRVNSEKESLKEAQEYYSDEEIMNIAKKKLTYEELYNTLKKIRDLYKERHNYYAQSNGLIGMTEEQNEVMKQYDEVDKKINQLENDFEQLDLFSDSERFNSSGWWVGATDSDETLKEAAANILQYMGEIQLSLGVIDEQEFTNLINSFSNVQKSAKETSETVEKLVDKPMKKLSTVYRAISDKNGSIIPLDRKDIWATDQADLYKTKYSSKGQGIEWQADFYSKNPLEIDAKGGHWTRVTNLGDGSDDTSKRITELYNSIQALTEKRKQLEEENQKETKQYIELRKELGLLQTEYNAISDSFSNVYGTHRTDEWVEYAKKNGYDALKISNINDDTNRLATSFAVFSEEQVKNVKVVAQTEEEFIKLHEKFVSELSSPITETETTQSTLEGNKQHDTSINVSPKVESPENFAKEVTNQLKGTSAKIDVKPQITDKAISDLLKEQTKSKNVSISAPKLNAKNLIEEFNLQGKDIDSNITSKVRDLSKEINKLSKEAIETNSDKSWEELVSHIKELGSILNSYGKIKLDTSQFESVLKVAEQLKGSRIFIGDNAKNDILSGSGTDNLRQLNNEFINLGVTFTTTRDKAMNLDDTWDEFIQSTGRMDLSEITVGADRLSKIIEELREAKNVLYGDKGLISADKYGTSEMVSYMEQVEKKQKEYAKVNPDKAEEYQRNIEFIRKEISAMKELASAVNQITTSVDEKTNAFREEEQVVTGTVQREISELERLSGELFSVRQDIENISSTITALPKIDFDMDLSKLNIENIDNAAIASFNTFREQLAGLEAQLNVSNLSEKLLHISEAFERLSRIENLENLNTKNLNVTQIVQLAEKAGSITELVEALNRLKECLDGLNTTSFDKEQFDGLKLTKANVNSMADMAVALETIGIALHSFDKDAKESLSSINELLDKSEALKDINSFMRSTEKDSIISIDSNDNIVLEDILPSDKQFKNAISDLDMVETKMMDIVKITKKSKKDSNGNFIEDYVVNYGNGSSETYRKDADSNKARLFNSSYVKFDAKTEEKAMLEVQKQITKEIDEQTSEQQKIWKLFLEEIEVQEQITKEIEKQNKAQQEKGRAFIEEQSNYISSKQEAEAKDRNIKANQELIDTIQKYSDIKKRIAKGDMFDGDVEEAEILEQKISELQNQPILHTSQIEVSERSLQKLYDTLDTIERKTQKAKETKVTETVKAPTASTVNKSNSISDNISNGTYKKSVDEITARFSKLNEEVKYNEDLVKELDTAYGKLKSADGVENKVQAYKEFEKALTSARNELSSLEQKSKGLDFAGKLEKQFKAVEAEYSKMSYLSSSLEELRKSITKIQNDAKETGADLSTLGQDAKQAFAIFNKGVLPSGDIVGSFGNLDEAIEKAKSMVNEYDKVKTELRTPLQVNDNGIAKMTAQVVDLNGELKTLTFVYNDATKTMVKQTTNIRKELSGIPGVIDAVSNKLKDMAVYWTATAFDPSDIMFKLREIADVVIDLNTQMTELAKVSGLSIDQLERRFNDWANTAKDLGATISDTISAAADWSRLGYSVDEAEKLAEVSILYKNVGDGIDIDQANESLVSTMQGFQMEASQAESIIDSFNEVSNNFAISSGGIGEALQRSAASFYAANTDLNSAIALITATNSVIQDPTRVGKQHIAYLYSNVMIIKVAILVKNQRWLRPRKDYNICFNY